MAGQPFSNGILGLVRAADASQAQMLLCNATELFVSEPCHSRSEVAMYVELALQLLRITPLEERVTIARMLAVYPAAPEAVMRQLMQDTYPVASIILEKALAVSEIDLLSTIASAPSSHLELIASRKGLPEAAVVALLNKMPVDALPALLANLSITLPATSIPYLVDQARRNPEIARQLAGRLSDVQDTDLIELFMSLDGRGRRRVIQALEIAALREFAARRPLPRLPLPPTEKVEALAASCLTRDIDAMAATLGDLLALPHAFARDLLNDRGGEPLAIALKASGVDAPLATRVILFSGIDDTRSYHEVKRLVELFDSVSTRSALLLADRWRGTPHDIPVRRHHVAQSEVGTPVRSRQTNADRHPVAQPAQRDRASN